MQVTSKAERLEETFSELLAVGIFEDEPGAETIVALNTALDGQIFDIVRAGDFKGRFKETALLYTQGRIPSARILLVGLGKQEQFEPDRLREMSSVAARRARELRLSSFSIAINAGLAPVDYAAQVIVEGAILGLYTFTGQRTVSSLGTEDGSRIESLFLVGFEVVDRLAVERRAHKGRVIAEAACLARDLVNGPGNIITPSGLAEAAERVAHESGFSCHVLDEAEIAELGMGAFMAVARGSSEPAKFIILEYGSKETHDTVVLIGKGVTFDSGGISLKPNKGLEMMKFDMAGAAAVLGTIQATAALALPLHIVCLIPAAENLLGEGAYKPGDVVRTLSGQTIEVVNTDCEGRLLLADALTYAHRFNPEAIIDIATLTYACIAAFGNMVTGLMTNDPSLATRLQAAGIETAERVWELPLFEDYSRQIRSQTADYKNRGGDPAGAITAALLLSKFAYGYPWAHLDIAGTAWIEQSSEYPERAYLPVSGGTGIGVRLLVNFLERWVNEQASPADNEKGHTSSASSALKEEAETPRLPSSSM